MEVADAVDFARVHRLIGRQRGHRAGRQRFQVIEDGEAVQGLVLPAGDRDRDWLRQLRETDKGGIGHGIRAVRRTCLKRLPVKQGQDPILRGIGSRGRLGQKRNGERVPRRDKGRDADGVGRRLLGVQPELFAAAESGVQLAGLVRDRVLPQESFVLDRLGLGIAYQLRQIRIFADVQSGQAAVDAVQKTERCVFADVQAFQRVADAVQLLQRGKAFKALKRGDVPQGTVHLRDPGELCGGEIRFVRLPAVGERLQIRPEIRIGEVRLIDREIPLLGGKNMYRLRLFRRFGHVRLFFPGELRRGGLFLRGLRRGRLCLLKIRFHPVERRRRQLEAGLLLRQSRARQQREQQRRKQQTAYPLFYNSVHPLSP